MGKKKHNYVNVPSVSETDEIMNDDLLSDDVRRDLITLHRINKNIKAIAMKAIDRLKSFINSNDISIEDNKINRMEIYTYDNNDSESNSLRLSEYLNNRYDKDSLKNATITSMTFITTTIELLNDILIVSKFAVVDYYMNNSKINDVMYIEDTFII